MGAVVAAVSAGGVGVGVGVVVGVGVGGVDGVGVVVMVQDPSPSIILTPDSFYHGKRSRRLKSLAEKRMRKGDHLAEVEERGYSTSGGLGMMIWCRGGRRWEGSVRVSSLSVFLMMAR